MEGAVGRAVTCAAGGYAKFVPRRAIEFDRHSLTVLVDVDDDRGTGATNAGGEHSNDCERYAERTHDSFVTHGTRVQSRDRRLTLTESTRRTLRQSHQCKTPISVPVRCDDGRRH